MTIRLSKYIDITSGVGGATVVNTRELIARLFTTNHLLPPQSFIEFDTLAEVGSYFGTTSEEYKRATLYFSWISPSITTPQKISFARWVDAAVAPMIFGEKLTASLSALQAITNGSFTLTLGGFTFNVGSLNFSAAGSLAAIATDIQTAIQAEVGGGVQWTGATVTYDNSSGGFNLVGGSAVVAPVSVAAGTTGTDISTLIGWLPESVNGSTGAIWANGSAIETITNTLTNSAQASNNFGSFGFTTAATLNLTQITEAAMWTDAQNIVYQYSVPVSNLTDAGTYNAALIGFSGVGVTLIDNDYAEMIPMIQMAATDYTRRNGTTNYMYKQFPTLTPSVTTDSDSDAYDALRVNYIGQTQTAGQLLAFYQRGVLMGGAAAPVDMNVFANEVWLKDAMGAAIMNLFLALSKVSANITGLAQILTVLQSVINQALFNGVISVGTTLTTTQQLFIEQITGDPLAWYQVANSGYWLNCKIVPIQNNAITEYQAQYTLVYKKDDIVRSVKGTHVLI